MSKPKPSVEKQYREFEKPRLAPWFQQTRPRWLVMEPAPIAAAAAALCSVAALLIQFVRQLRGVPVSPQEVLIGTALTFVVSYTLVGALVYYILCVASRELWRDQSVNKPETTPADAVPSRTSADKGEEQ